MRRLHVVVTGAGGFIGHHLCNRLRDEGHHIRGIDLREPAFEPTRATDFVISDLREFNACAKAVDGSDWVFQLAADMGGIGYLSANRGTVARNNATINMNMLEASRRANVTRYFFASSACVYPKEKQTEGSIQGLREDDAMPANPEPGYGWEKLFTEHVTSEYAREGMDTRIARFHNIYGPLGTYEGGREKAPAALCRKIAMAKRTMPKGQRKINVWGDGEQTRSFCYVDDCIEAVVRLMHASVHGPVNIGSDERVTINVLAELIAEIAKTRITSQHESDAAVGVRSRSSDNGNLIRAIGYAPRTPLRVGLRPTYDWIESQVGTSKTPARQRTRADAAGTEGTVG